MNCKEVISFLDDYVAGSLPAARLALFERHLAVCASCRAYLASYRATIALARAAHPDPPTLPTELLKAILSTVSRNTDR